MSDVPPRTKKLERRYLDHLAGIIRPIVRAEFGGNQTEFAKAVGVSQPQIAQLLRADGDRGIGIVVLMQLRKYLQISLDDMLGLPPVPRAPVPKDELVAAVLAALDRREAEARAREVPRLPPGPTPPPPSAPKRKKPDSD